MCGTMSCTPPSTSTSWLPHGGPRRSVRRSSNAGGSRLGGGSGYLGTGQPRRGPRSVTLRPPQPAHEVRRLDDLLTLPADFALGTKRARAAALLMFALPGGAYIYQGQELGLPEVEDLPDAVLQDPAFEHTRHQSRGRDGCRVPLPWCGLRPPFGFSPPDATADPWLPQPRAWADLTAAAQDQDPESTLALFREALRWRHDEPALGDGALHWLDAPEGALLFIREPRFACLVNVAASPLPLPTGTPVLLSGPLTPTGQLPADTTAWLHRP